VIESIRCKNFQSLQDVQLDLGKFTVIVGESSSGKSALIRALKAVSSNQLNSDYITRGTKHSYVAVKTESATVTIKRDLGGSSAYQVAKAGSQESSYTKLNRQVPAEVTEILGITPSTIDEGSINFAGQFDPPYLLKDSGNTVAKTLGELTKVSTIFAAVKEANRRTKNASTLLNLRKKDLDIVLKQIKQYSGITEKAKRLGEAEELYQQAANLDTEYTRLASLVTYAQQASDALGQVKNTGEVPDVAPAVLAQEKLDEYKSLLRQALTAQKSLTAAQASIITHDSAILLAEEELHQHLLDAGECPLCKQEISV
jgi:DNA repair protein SbcC/Rad50